MQREPTLRLKDFKADEHILVIARKHWFVFFLQILGLIILFLIPFFFIPFLSIFIAGQNSGPITINAGYGIFFASLWGLILWQMLFARWTNFYYDEWIITNWRIIDIEQKGFFRRNVATLLNLDHIEDITTEVGSVFGTFLNYGTLQVQTAASKTEFFMVDIAQPREVERIIRKAQEARIGLRPGKGHE